MNLPELKDWLAGHVERGAADSKTLLEEVMPVVEALAASPLAGLPIANLSAELLTQLATVIMDADQKAGAARQAQADADAAAQAALAAAQPEQPAEPEAPAA